MLALLLVLLALFLVHQFWWRRRGLPPGPVPWPLFGNLLSFISIERWEDRFAEWTKTYGNVHTYWMGWMSIVAINDVETMQEVFVKQHPDDCIDRAAAEVFQNALRGGVYGLAETSGPLWLDQRRFVLKVMRGFGLNTNLMQERVFEELGVVFEKANAEIAAGNEEIDFDRLTDIATGSLINAVICGYRFSADERTQAKFFHLKGVLSDIMASFQNPLLMLSVHNRLLSKAPIFSTYFNRLVALQSEIRDFLNECIDEHLARTDYSAADFEPKDLIDAYIWEQKRQEATGEPTYFSRRQLEGTCSDMWFAGQESTSSTVTWGIAFLIRHPDVQQKLHDELDRVIGSDRLVTVSDKLALPYVQAVIMEVLRVANIVGQNVPHKTSRELTIAGYKIPKGSIVIPQISVPMCDPKHFPEPKRFNPDRFIDEGGKLKKSPALMPFSLGRRQCPGEGLARMELFLFLTNLFNQYRFLPAKEPPTLRKSASGFALGTAPYKVRLERRF
ncbi:(pine wood nematode) hypothetical protein [Aphelenchoides fujianensis]|nr:(pine wood nematode) hypothetical protein [Aphelenchoides fujianensis]